MDFGRRCSHATFANNLKIYFFPLKTTRPIVSIVDLKHLMVIVEKKNLNCNFFLPYHTPYPNPLTRYGTKYMYAQKVI